MTGERREEYIWKGVGIESQKMNRGGGKASKVAAEPVDRETGPPRTTADAG